MQCHVLVKWSVIHPCRCAQKAAAGMFVTTLIVDNTNLYRLMHGADCLVCACNM